MTALLLANAAATFFMIGLAWFVQVVHYPLFPLVGEQGFAEYHRVHSSRTTWVVLPAMSIELLTSFLLLIDPPGDQGALVALGAALAALTWILTFFAASAHGRIGRQGLGPISLRRLLAVGWVRTAIWTAHGLVVIVLLESVIVIAGA